MPQVMPINVVLPAPLGPQGEDLALQMVRLTFFNASNPPA